MKIDPPSLNSGNALWTVNSVPRVFRPKVASKCRSVISPSGMASPMPALAYRTSILPFFPLDRVEQAVEVVEIGRVAAHAGYVPANQLDGLVERLLPPARDENIGAFFNEPLGARQCHAARSTRDDSNLTLKLSHNFSFRGVGTASAPENLDMGLPASGVECGSAHIGGAKSIRLDD